MPDLQVHEWLLLAPVLVVSFYQLFYLVQSLRVRIAPRGEAPLDPAAGEPCSVLVPVLDSASTLGRCLESLLANDLRYVDKVVVVLERCSDGSPALARSFVPRFAAAGCEMEVLDLPPDRWGKVAGLLHGSGHLRTRTVLLLDADVVLEPSAVAELLSHHRRWGGPFSSCLVFPFQEPGGRVGPRDHVIRNNRLYRQGVLQAVKDLFGVANFPGGVQVVEMDRYRELLVDGFLEDLSATYAVLAAGGRVAILPRVLAYEIERGTLGGLLLQRVRWTIGALQHLRTQVRTAARRRRLAEKLLVNSYHVMWELQHYVLVASLLALPFSPALRPLLALPLLLYALQIGRSVYLSRHHYRHTVAGPLLHCLVFPFVITCALVGSFLLLVRERRFFFGTTALYRRS